MEELKHACVTDAQTLVVERHIWAFNKTPSENIAREISIDS